MIESRRNDMVLASIVWLLVFCVLNILDAGIAIEKEDWGFFTYRMFEAAVLGFAAYTLWTCCK